LWGTTVAGEMLDFEPTTACLKFRANAVGPQATVPFGRMRRLVLTTPLVPAPKFPGAPVERVPSAAQERDYRLQMKDGTALTGRTAGYVVTDAGLYLFTPLGEDRSLQREFVPRSAYNACEFGASAEEAAAERWIATRHELLAAIDRQSACSATPGIEQLLHTSSCTCAAAAATSRASGWLHRCDSALDQHGVAHKMAIRWWTHALSDRLGGGAHAAIAAGAGLPRTADNGG
jgi:hypothetical protein